MQKRGVEMIVSNKVAMMLGVVVVAVTGCASTGVIPMGPNTYMIGKKDGSPGVGVSLSNKAAVYKEAGEFCMKKGLEVKTISEEVTPSYPFHLGSTEIQFSCVQPNEHTK